MRFQWKGSVESHLESSSSKDKETTEKEKKSLRKDISLTVTGQRSKGTLITLTCQFKIDWN